MSTRASSAACAASCAARGLEPVGEAFERGAGIARGERRLERAELGLQRREPREHRLHRRVLLRVEPRQLVRDLRVGVLRALELRHARVEAALQRVHARVERGLRGFLRGARGLEPVGEAFERGAGSRAASVASSAPSLASSGASRANTVSTVASFCA